MNTIIDNWYLVVCLIAFVCCIAQGIIFFVAMPNSKKLESLKEFLLYAVVEAEKKFKGGTGQLKLRYVYNLAIERFPWVARVITFQEFSDYVDEALDWLKIQLEFNTSLKSYVEGDVND